MVMRSTWRFEYSPSFEGTMHLSINPDAKTGKYQVLANYFGSDANRTQVRTKVYVTVYQNFGDAKRETVERRTITLSNAKEKRDLTTVSVAN